MFRNVDLIFLIVRNGEEIFVFVRIRNVVRKEISVGTLDCWNRGEDKNSQQPKGMQLVSGEGMWSGGRNQNEEHTKKGNSHVRFKKSHS
jgi:hypothetical protein